MRAIIDEQGRLEIPLELRERLHLTAGVLVDVEPNEDGLQITPTSSKIPDDSGEGALEWDNGLLVFRGPGVLTVEDVNDAIEAGRQERFDRIVGNGVGAG